MIDKSTESLYRKSTCQIVPIASRQSAQLAEWSDKNKGVVERMVAQRKSLLVTGGALAGLALLAATVTVFVRLSSADVSVSASLSEAPRPAPEVALADSQTDPAVTSVSLAAPSAPAPGADLVGTVPSRSSGEAVHAPGSPTPTAAIGRGAALSVTVDPGPVPVLMYHEIATGPNTLYLPPDQFADQMDALEQAGFRAVTLQEMHQHLTRGKPLPRHPVVLTFDDGYTSFYTAAWPTMRKHGFTGTLFVITADVGLRGFVTWDQIKELADAGADIEAHTVNHLDLTTLNGDRLNYELAESRKVLEAHTGRSVLFFAYPAGRYNAKTMAAVSEAGFLGAVTTVYGTTTPDQDPREWKRLRMNPGLTGKGLVNLLLSLEPKDPPATHYDNEPLSAD
jgi:peptidoglycan/xylan/chitin deacetylase (PgdA/CDA1 family)